MIYIQIFAPIVNHRAVTDEFDLLFLWYSNLLFYCNIRAKVLGGWRIKEKTGDYNGI